MEVWKEHLLTSDEQDAFEQEGYFVVENALSPDEVDRINAAMDRCEIESRDANKNLFTNLFRDLCQSP